MGPSTHVFKGVISHFETEIKCLWGWNPLESGQGLARSASVAHFRAGSASLSAYVTGAEEIRVWTGPDTSHFAFWPWDTLEWFLSSKTRWIRLSYTQEHFLIQQFALIHPRMIFCSGLCLGSLTDTQQHFVIDKPAQTPLRHSAPNFNSSVRSHAP